MTVLVHGTSRKTRNSAHPSWKLTLNRYGKLRSGYERLPAESSFMFFKIYEPKGLVMQLIATWIISLPLFEVECDDEAEFEEAFTRDLVA